MLFRSEETGKTVYVCCADFAEDAESLRRTVNPERTEAAATFERLANLWSSEPAARAVDSAAGNPV